ncbi:hypothetical protein P4S52_20680 [Vibrio sp. SA48]|uniref:hypothetical protein n=1 Tax=Vibrio aestuarianus TaxID=28171 RepID=UPI00159338E1|nr:hypothetical protein [Vibrio aestuarianus]NGZ19170.1 hypothetical protein [Vibrio aestuarianus]
MQDRSSYSYILMGIITRCMQHGSCTYKTAIKGKKDLKELLVQETFEVTMQMFSSIAFLDLYSAIESIDDDKIDNNLPSDLQNSLKSEFSSLEKVLFAEASTKKIFTLPSRRYTSEYLLNSPHNLLKQGNFDKLSELAKLDFTSSTRCIVFGESTAAAFHILRSTEDTLKQYYFLHRKQKRLTKPMWGNMVDQLRAKKNNKPPSSLLDSLDMIRKNYRNPTQHPEATYTIDSAQDLFGVCLDAIGKMADEL